MNPPPNGAHLPLNGTPRFAVVHLDRASVQLQAIYERAAVLGKSSDVVVAVRAIVERLASSPRNFGEREYTLSNAQLDVRTAAVGPLFVGFGVHRQHAVVYIREFHAILGE